MEFMPMHFNRFDDNTGCCIIFGRVCSQRSQKKKCMYVCHNLQEQLKNDHQFLTKVVRGDESWCYGYDSESKQQTSQRKSPNSPRPKQSTASSLKCQDNVDFFFDVDGSLYLQEITINQQFYFNVLQRLRESPRQKAPRSGGVRIGSCTMTMTPPHSLKCPAVFG